MSYEKLDYVITLAEEQNITKAARKLFISQPALTLAINKLEQELNIKLFNRQVSPIKLTEAGMVYIEEMGKIRQINMNMNAKLMALSQTEQQLCMLIGKGRGQYWLPLLLPRLKELYPTLNIVIPNTNYHSLKDVIQNESVDLTIGTYSISEPGLIEEPLVVERLLYVIPKTLNLIDPAQYQGHSLKRPLSIDPSILNNCSFVCSESSYTYPRFLELEMKQHQFHYGNLFVYGSPQVSTRLAAGGMGIAFTSQYICEWEHIEHDFDVFFCTLDSTPSQTIRAFYKKEAPNNALIQSILSIIRCELLPVLYPESSLL